MPFEVTRRNFLAGLGAAAAASAAPSLPAWALFDPPLYPPMDLSYFDTPIAPAPAEIRLGYASITWNGNDRQAIEDIAALGFRGIQLRANVIKDFSSAGELKDLLQKHQLMMVALSSGGVHIDPAIETEEIAKHTTMEGTDLILIDMDPSDPFDFYLKHYQRQLIAGYSKTTKELGLRVFMKDFNKLTPPGHQPLASGHVISNNSPSSKK